ncbi:hypothetical protein NPA07_01275 [Mycoplasmopsis caviae]|uniref:Lipoprotein n=1 Tax=Mycoplasmopsis caviae TaxID=55603 RepID=A0A3P8KAN8_9BACT|nr:hypothetical protein [Mycoplasmopsis caviae]UUD35489.1 hypothetical protein NPA07_01275 [Mycoplasmopsis caviae]VDR41734.1 Uncharacterised protein [Mycoplasmopsis caviae]
MKKTKIFLSLASLSSVGSLALCTISCNPYAQRQLTDEVSPLINLKLDTKLKVSDFYNPTKSQVEELKENIAFFDRSKIQDNIAVKKPIEYSNDYKIVDFGIEKMKSVQTDVVLIRIRVKKGNITSSTIYKKLNGFAEDESTIKYSVELSTHFSDKRFDLAHLLAYSQDKGEEYLSTQGIGASDEEKEKLEKFKQLVETAKAKGNDVLKAHANKILKFSIPFSKYFLDKVEIKKLEANSKKISVTFSYDVNEITYDEATKTPTVKKVTTMTDFSRDFEIPEI